MKVCVITAGGLQERWTSPTCKHLQPLPGNQTVIGRLHNQLSPHFDKTYVIAWRPEIVALFPDAIFPADSKVLHNSILATKNLWDDRTVIAYGDCVLSPQTIEKIVSFDGPIQFFGDYSEIYAFSFDRTMHERWAKALAEGATWTDRAWATYRAFWGMKMRGLQAHDGGKKEFTQINDGSTDCDEIADLPRIYESVKRWK